MSVIILSGPIGAGKTTVARELLALLPAPVSYIEGDTFWSFVAKAHSRDRREVFRVIMRSMAAASVPFARSGYAVVLDFSIPPQFLDTARKILKEVPLNYVVLRPSLAVCEARAATRAEGKILDYTAAREFYTLFEDCQSCTVCDDEADASVVAKRIHEGLTSGKFAVA
jgi:adenylylsulfate kinase-like enzyme